MAMQYPVQRSYADVIMSGIGGIEDTIAENRRRRDELARQEQEFGLRERNYADQLGLSNRDFDYRQQQDTLENERANRRLAFDEAQAKRGVAGTYGMQPLWVDPDGAGPEEPYPTQLSTQGGARRIDLPAGAQAFDPYTKAYETRRGTEAGGARGKAAGDLPVARSNLETALNLTDQLIGNQDRGIREHEGLRGATGPIQGNIPNWLLGITSPASVDARARIEQLTGRAFLEAYSTLRGGGQIANIEGEKATQAIARMKAAVRDEDFITALKDFRDAIWRGYQAMEETAGQEPTQQPAADGEHPLIPNGGQQTGTVRRRFNPQTGEIE